MARRTPWHPRLYPAPYSDLIFDSRMLDWREELVREGRRGERERQDIVLDFAALRLTGKPETRWVDEQPWEVVRGERAPYRLRFRSAEWIRRDGPYADPAAQTHDADARRLFYLVHLRDASTGPRYVFVTDAQAPGELSLRAAGCALEEREGEIEPVEYLRRWSAAPPTPACLVPRPPKLHKRYGGDPIRIRLRGRALDCRLFIGGLHVQHHRPARGGYGGESQRRRESMGAALRTPPRRPLRGEGGDAPWHDECGRGGRGALCSRRITRWQAGAGPLLRRCQSLGDVVLRLTDAAGGAEPGGGAGAGATRAPRGAP